jgi:hypothetical protein
MKRDLQRLESVATKRIIPNELEANLGSVCSKQKNMQLFIFCQLYIIAFFILAK